MGYLYYGNYAQYYEIGRVEFLRSMGLTYKELEENHGVMMPVMSMQTRYVRPVYYDDLITISTALRKLPDQSITFHMKLKNEAGKLVNGGSVKLCFLDAETKKSVKAPQVLLDILKANFK